MTKEDHPHGEGAGHPKNADRLYGLRTSLGRVHVEGAVNVPKLLTTDFLS